MLIALSPRIAICQSFSEVLLTAMFPLVVLCQRFNFKNFIIIIIIIIIIVGIRKKYKRGIPTSSWMLEVMNDRDFQDESVDRSRDLAVGIGKG